MEPTAEYPWLPHVRWLIFPAMLLVGAVWLAISFVQEDRDARRWPRPAVAVCTSK